MRNAIVFTLATVALTGSVLASEQERQTRAGTQVGAAERSSRCAVHPKTEWLSVDQIKAKLKEQGFAVRKIEQSQNCFEVKATDAQGKHVEIYVDPTTAEVVKREGRS